MLLSLRPRILRTFLCSLNQGAGSLSSKERGLTLLSYQRPLDCAEWQAWSRDALPYEKLLLVLGFGVASFRLGYAFGSG